MVCVNLGGTLPMAFLQKEGEGPPTFFFFWVPPSPGGAGPQEGELSFKGAYNALKGSPQALRIQKS